MNNFKYLRVFIIFFFIFALSTKLGVSSWNDASRMDTIQSIVEEHSFIIDNSFFETGDKFLYNGHFYSDKPPLLALAVSPIYFFLNIFGITFASHTKLAYYLLLRASAI